jgi:uncharacterized membrane protein
VIFSSRGQRNSQAVSRPRGVTDNTRIGALSDGVFSITITLLVLDLRVPQVAPGQTLADALFGEHLPGHLLGYAVSIVLSGIYWVGQHNMFFHIKGHDRILLWLNILFLGLVASMPFWTNLLVTYSQETLAVIAYAGILALIGLTLDAIWRYASHDHRLVDPNIDPQLVAFVHRRVLIAPIVYLISIAISFVSTTVAELLFAVVAVLYIVPNPLDHYHHQALNPVSHELEMEDDDDL